MSQSGAIQFYTTSKPADPRRLIRALLDLTRPRQLWGIHRTAEEEEWEDFLKSQSLPPADDVQFFMYAGEGEEHLNEKMPLDQVPQEYREGQCLHMVLAGSPFEDRIRDAVWDGIPPEFAGFVPNWLVLDFGWHDIFETVENPDGLFIARAFCTISFFGQRTPNDWQGFREALFKLPEVLAVKRELETVTGPLEHCVLWSI